MLLNKKGQNYADFKMIEGWSTAKIDNTYYQHRRKIPDELRNKRDAHIKRMYNEGTPMAWIAKLYRCSRVQVLRIIKG